MKRGGPVLIALGTAANAAATTTTTTTPMAAIGRNATSSLATTIPLLAGS